jgi:signal transduction histidine kinase
VVIRRRAPLLVRDVWDETWAARLFRASLAQSEGGLPPPDRLGSWIGVPLVARDRVVGVLVVRHRVRGHFTPHHVTLAQAVANHAAVALENARLYREAQRAAAEEERRRLARELHDSVTQTLFAAKTTADVLPGLWERDPEVGREALAALGRLTRGAYTEMRSLLVELRPETLTRAPLHELLQTLVAAVTAKSRLTVEAALDPVPLLPADVQVALYRIAQEALTNVAKHAGASRLSFRLGATPLAGPVPPRLLSLSPSKLAVSLEVADDGRGFVPAAAPRGRLGLASMGERAAGVGAALRLQSQPGAGTRVSVTWTGDVATAPGAARAELSRGASPAEAFRPAPPAEPALSPHGAGDPVAHLEEHSR